MMIAGVVAMASGLSLVVAAARSIQASAGELPFYASHCVYTSNDDPGVVENASEAAWEAKSIWLCYDQGKADVREFFCNRPDSMCYKLGNETLAFLIPGCPANGCIPDPLPQGWLIGVLKFLANATKELLGPQANLTYSCFEMRGVELTLDHAGQPPSTWQVTFHRGDLDLVIDLCRQPGA